MSETAILGVVRWINCRRAFDGDELTEVTVDTDDPRARKVTCVFRGPIARDAGERLRRGDLVEVRGNLQLEVTLRLAKPLVSGSVTFFAKDFSAR